MNLALIFLGFFLLVIGGEFIVRASVALSLRFNISKFVIGMTVVSFATSLPELIVSINAAFEHFYYYQVCIDASVEEDSLP